MQRKLRLLSIAAALGVAVFVCAQVVIGREAGQERGSFKGAPIAGKSAPALFSSYAPSQAMVALRYWITTHTNVAFREAEAKRQEPIMALVIKVQCYTLLTAMHSLEQTHEIDSVWQVSKFKPNGEWNDVIQAPSLIVTLDDVEDGPNKKIHEILREGWDRRMKKYDELSERIRKETGNDQAAFAKRYNAELAKLHAAQGGLVEMAKATRADVASDMEKIRALLTPVQRQEWDGIVAGLETKLRLAVKGENPLLSDLRQ